MEISVPKYVLQYEDWTDRELVLLSVMLYLYQNEGCRLGIQYHFNAVDIKRLLGMINSINPDTKLDRLRRVMRVGMLSWDIWRLELTPNKFEKTRNGRVEEGSCDIQDSDAIGLFYYLAGRFTAPDIIQEHRMTLDSEVIKGRKVGTVMDHFFAKQILN